MFPQVMLSKILLLLFLIFSRATCAHCVIDTSLTNTSLNEVDVTTMPPDTREVHTGERIHTHAHTHTHTHTHIHTHAHTQARTHKHSFTHIHTHTHTHKHTHTCKQPPCSRNRLPRRAALDSTELILKPTSTKVTQRMWLEVGT
jgi:hypothetical protein